MRVSCATAVRAGETLGYEFRGVTFVTIWNYGLKSGLQQRPSDRSQSTAEADRVVAQRQMVCTYLGAGIGRKAGSQCCDSASSQRLQVRLRVS